MRKTNKKTEKQRTNEKQIKKTKKKKEKQTKNKEI